MTCPPRGILECPRSVIADLEQMLATLAFMEPLYDGRVSLNVGDTVAGPWALPKWENVSVGRLPGAGIHVPNSWVPSRLCRFMPYERGWLVQLGRARGRFANKYLGDITFRARTVVALQPGTTLISFPELDDHCKLLVTIGADQAEGLEVVQDQLGSEEEVARTSYAAGRVDLPDSHRRVLAVAFEHLLQRRPAPANVAATAASRLGMSEQAVKNVIAKTKKRVNEERWLNLDTTEQLGHYLANLSRNLTWNDLPPEFRDR